MIKESLIALLSLAVVASGGYYFGADSVRVEWEKDIAIRQAIVERTTKLNEAHNAELIQQFEEDIENAKTKASRDAVRGFLNAHGLLPDGTPLHGVGRIHKADIPEGTDACPSEPGLTQRIEELAGRCITDARLVEACAEWARREDLPVK